jgi:hypothetical protein
MMDLSDFYPAPSELSKSELSVLDFLRGNRYMKDRHPQIAVDAHNYYLRNQSSRTGFEFNSHFDTWHASMASDSDIDRNGRRLPNARLTVSARIEIKGKLFTNVSYCLSVCRIRSAHRTSQITIMRKFHFDVVAAEAGTKRHVQQHPQCHLQYCGDMVPYMTTVGCRQTQLDQMHPWLSEPRIFFWPMSLALLIDMALHEFPDQDSAKFRADSYWRGRVREQESLVLGPFYEKCVEVIRDTAGNNRTLSDAFYVG